MHLYDALLLGSRSAPRKQKPMHREEGRAPAGRDPVPGTAPPAPSGHLAPGEWTTAATPARPNAGRTSCTVRNAAPCSDVVPSDASPGQNRWHERKQEIFNRRCTQINADGPGSGMCVHSESRPTVLGEPRRRGGPSPICVYLRASAAKVSCLRRRLLPALAGASGCSASGHSTHRRGPRRFGRGGNTPRTVRNALTAGRRGAPRRQEPTRQSGLPTAAPRSARPAKT